MSMLTPPGLGGQYRITGNRYPRMRRSHRRRRVTVAAVSTAAALGLLSWGTLQLVDVFTGGGDEVRAAGAERGCERGGPGGAAPSASAVAAAPGGSGGDGKDNKGDKGDRGDRGDGGGEPDELPEPSAITVNVYNATTRGNLARNTADELEKRGFAIGEVANAPASLDKKVKAAGLLMGPPGLHRTGAFDVLETQLEGAEVRTVDRRGTEVDLVIGNAFEGLTGQKDAEKALAALASPSPSPSPSPRAC